VENCTLKDNKKKKKKQKKNTKILFLNNLLIILNDNLSCYSILNCDQCYRNHRVSGLKYQ
jgi:hypothetical protein